MASKGEQFLEDAIKAGWDSKMESEDGKETVTCVFENGKMKMVMIWDGTCYNYKESYQILVTGAKKTVRNASEARRVLQGASGIKPEQRSRSNKPLLADDFDTPDMPPRRPEPHNLPFKISDPDRAIIESVIGKKIVWWSESKRVVESSAVMANPKQNHLKIVRKGSRRILNWAAAGEGFRSVYIDLIVEVL
jgi:hypothetical protein